MNYRLLFFSLFACFFAANLLPKTVSAQNISTVAGCGIGNDSFATNAELVEPMKVVFDAAGNAYIADDENYMVRKVDPSGVITTVAGTGAYGHGGDGGPATAAVFRDIYSVAVDRAGDLFIADEGNNRIRKVNPAGIVTNIAGTGTAGYNGDSRAANTAELNGPSDVAVDTSGNIYIADRYNYRVRKINPAGIITTVAGNGTYSSTTVFGGPATATELGYPFKIALDSKGNLFISSYEPYHVMKVDTSGTLTNVVGTGVSGFSGDGSAATAATTSTPCGIVVDTAGNVYFSDISHARVRMVNAATGIVTTIVGTGATGYSGDGGPAITAEINEPEGLSFDAGYNLYIADWQNNRIRMVSPAGMISTFAGQNTLFGEGYPGVNTEMTFAEGVAVDASGNVYIADFFNARVRMMNATTGIITTVAGSGLANFESSFTGDGGPATMANLARPFGVAVDASGNLYICDRDLQRVRMVNTSGVISTIAGNGTAGYGGTDIPATVAELNDPTDIAVDAAGNVYVSDQNNQRVRKISTSGMITTIAGNGVAGYIGDGAAAVDAELNNPVGVAVDASGDVYIGDQDNHAIRMVDTTGIITTIAGNGAPGYSGDGGPASAAQLRYPLGLMVDNAGNIFIADAGNAAIRVISNTGIINTLAGTGTAGFSGDGGLATLAQLHNPFGVTVDHSGNMYIADNENHRIRKVNISSYLAALSAPATKAALRDVLVYPNPTNGNINIINAANGLALVYDITGTEVMKTPVTSAAQTLDLGSLASGIYLVQVISQNGQSKIVKVTKE